MQVQVIAVTEEQKEFEGEKYTKRAAQCVGMVDNLQKVFTVGLQKDAPAPKPGIYTLEYGEYVAQGRLSVFVKGFVPVQAK